MSFQATFKDSSSIAHSHSFAFLGSLIYSSVIYHRYRRNKRKGLNSNNITQSPYYNGPYNENSLAPTQYQPLDAASTHTHDQPADSPYPYTPGGVGTTVFSSDGIVSPLLKRDADVHGHYVGELPGSDRKSMSKDAAMELSATPEVYELSDTRSTRNRW